MARFYGEVGYGKPVETPPNSGVWVDTITELQYQGDIIRNASTVRTDQKANSDIFINNSISIVADQYAVENFFNIKYVKWAGGYWTVQSVEVRIPRLILTLGSDYDGPTS